MGLTGLTGISYRGSSEAIRKMHWVRWQKVTKPKEDGGLGL